MTKYIVPAIPPSENKYKGRQNHWQYRSDKQLWAQLISVYCRPRVSYKGKVQLTLTYYFPTRSRHDPNNYSGQFITDGLVECGIIEDDDFSHIDLHLVGLYDKHRPRVEITIEEAQI